MSVSETTLPYVPGSYYEEFLADLHTIERALTTINRSVVKCHQLLDRVLPHNIDQWDRYAGVVRRLSVAGRDIAKLGTTLANRGTTVARSAADAAKRLAAEPAVPARQPPRSPAGQPGPT
jgi:hypothetical protein